MSIEDQASAGTGDTAELTSTPWGSTAEFATVAEITRAAKAKLEPGVWNFVEGGSGDEWTLAENRRAFERWQFRPRMMTGISAPDLRTEVLGIPLSMPVLTAPFGFDAMVHPEGHLAVTRAAAAAGTACLVPAISAFPMEEVAAAGPAAARIFQLIPMGEEAAFVKLGARARDAGYSTLCVTVDTLVPGWRERSMEDRFSPDPSVVLGNLGIPDFMAISAFDAQEWSWSTVTDLCREVGLPWIAKGILTSDDARAAVAAGASGVFVSNHGGRQLDGAPAAASALPEVAAEIGGEVVVGLDGGIRRGSDVVKALALGADVVAVGRPVIMGLAAAGEAGVARVLELLQKEMATTMSLVGRPTVADIDSTCIMPAPR